MKDTALHPETETQKNIRHYKAQLPHARGKIAATLWMLALSAVLMVGASFAWYTLSQAPEATGMTTTVTGNGSLEIALSDSEGSEPASSAVGDSMSVSGQSVTVSNLTWGNLVNLSDASYGLDQITLYPSRLNASSLRNLPLVAVDYGSDGRVSSLSDPLWYATWDTTYQYWSIISSGSEYGVRAVGSVTTSSTGEADLATLTSAAQSKLMLAEDAYAAVVSSDAGYMEALVEMVGDRIDERLNGSTRNYAGYTETIYNVYLDLTAAAEKLGDAYIAIAEIYQYSLYGATEGVKNYTPYNLAALCSKTEAQWAAEGITLTGWDAYLQLLADLEENMEEAFALYTAANAGESIGWSDAKPVLQVLFPYDTATYTYKNGVRVYTWDELTSNMVAISWFLCADSDSEETLANNIAYVELYEGLLYDFEELISYSATTERLEAHFTYDEIFYGWDLWIQMVVSTASTNDYAADAIAAAPEDTSAGEGSLTAAETYGMAIDLWVRSNASGENYLLLDGALVTDDVGNVIGYEGSNRIWEDYNSVIVNGTSTTQGGGSCYVFYYETAEDLPRILDLLDGMTVVFFQTDTGTKLATASFDTTNYYENSGGRVTVPLVVDRTGSNTYTVYSESGEVVSTSNYITALTRNQAVRITALLYLDGSKVTNEEASATTDFIGTLNLQFASTATLTTAAQTDSDLYTEAVELSATVSSSVNEDSSVSATVTLNVGGSASPANVTASFGRQVNSGSQALKQQTLEFTQTGEGVWTLTTTFTTPGTYVLNNVTLDGVEYELEEALTVTVAGFDVTSLSWEYADSSYTLLTADSAITIPVTMTLGTAYTGDETVRVALVSSGGKYTYATLTSADGGKTWTGSATVTTSGTYTLKYFYVGSDVYDIPTGLQKTLVAYMGLRASVQLTSASFEDGETTIVYDSASASNVYEVSVSVSLTDNSGKVLRNITGTGGLADGQTMGLYYSKADSSTAYLYTALTWDSSTSRYVGTFSVNDLGVYSFSGLTIGSQTVTATSSAPSLVVRYYVETVPEYSANNTANQQTVIGGYGAFSITMTNASSGWAIKAKVKDLDEATDVYYILDGTMTKSSATGTSQWSFDVKDDSGEGMEGNFQLVELQLYTEGEGGSLVSAIDVESCEIVTKIVTTVYFTEAYDGVTVTGSDTITLTGGYAATTLASVDNGTSASSNFYAVTTYDAEALTVTLVDFEGKAVDGLTVVSLAYELDTTSTSDYGYTIVYGEDNAPVLVSSQTAVSSDKRVFTFSDAPNFNLWGKYTATLTYTVGGTTYTVEDVAGVEYAQGTLPTFGNSSGTLTLTGNSWYSNGSTSRKWTTNALVTAGDGYEYFSFIKLQSTVSKGTSNNLYSGQSIGEDSDGNDFIWYANYGLYFGTTMGLYAANMNSSQLVAWNLPEWIKPPGYVQMYAQNIYLSDEDAPAVWMTVEDGVVGVDGSIADGNILYGQTTAYYLTRNFAYTEAISSDGLISQSTLDGKTIYGMGVGRVTGDDEDDSYLWSTNTAQVAGAERIIYGTITKKETIAIEAAGTYSGYATAELVTMTNGYLRIAVTDSETSDTLKQEVITGYEPLQINVIYIQYNGVTYEVETSNIFAIDMYCYD